MLSCSGNSEARNVPAPKEGEIHKVCKTNVTAKYCAVCMREAAEEKFSV